MQPIHYSLIINLIALLICAGLAWLFAAPWLVIVAMLMQTHALERFQSQANHPDEDDYPEQPMGFNADIK
jgi:hypothetical protein